MSFWIFANDNQLYECMLTSKTTEYLPAAMKCDIISCLCTIQMYIYDSGTVWVIISSDIGTGRQNAILNLSKKLNSITKWNAISDSAQDSEHIMQILDLFNTAVALLSRRYRLIC